ncbi:hypothetical protein [Streptomyces sp. NPDC096132]|uniref:hypothetical protein n=1 Tax=Streptomyces sp. NPDC096132 TaxID=3366075 RepID=UPI0037FCDE5C
MRRQVHVVIHAPDGRGLRTVSVDGQAIGKTWSLRGLKRILRKSGFSYIDLDNPGHVRWSETKEWPDHAWRRHASAILIALALLASAALLLWVGLADIFRALTFGGRVMGVVFLVAALSEIIAVMAVFDYFGKRRVRYSGEATLIGAVTLTATSLVFLILQWLGGDHGTHLWRWVGLSAWSIWTLWALSRQKIWQGIPYPKSFALGVALSAIIGAASLTYSAMYVPYAAPVKVPFRISYGKPTVNANRTVLNLPAHITFRNEGDVSIYVVGTLWRAKVWPSKYTEDGGRMNEWKGELQEGYWIYGNETFPAPSRILGSGEFTGAGSRLDPGDDFSSDPVIPVSLKSAPGRVEIYAIVSYIRADRCKLANSYSQSVEYSWDADSQSKEHIKDAPEWLAEKGDDYFRYESRIYRSSKIMELTSDRDYVSMWWVLPKWREGSNFEKGGTNPYMEVHISRDPNAEERLNDSEQEPYGMKTVNIFKEVPIDQLLKEAEG